MFAGTPSTGNAPYAGVSPQLLAALARIGRPGGLGQGAQGFGKSQGGSTDLNGWNPGGQMQRPGSPQPNNPFAGGYPNIPMQTNPIISDGINGSSTSPAQLTPFGAFHNPPDAQGAQQTAINDGPGGSSSFQTPGVGAIAAGHPVLNHFHMVDAAQQLAKQLTEHYQRTLRTANLR